MLKGVRSLRQVPGPLAYVHVDNRSRHFDEHGDNENGSKVALDAADAT